MWKPRQKQQCEPSLTWGLLCNPGLVQSSFKGNFSMEKFPLKLLCTKPDTPVYSLTNIHSTFNMFLLLPRILLPPSNTDKCCLDGKLNKPGQERSLWIMHSKSIIGNAVWANWNSFEKLLLHHHLVAILTHYKNNHIRLKEQYRIRIFFLCISLFFLMQILLRFRVQISLFQWQTLISKDVDLEPALVKICTTVHNVAMSGPSKVLFFLSVLAENLQ